MRFKEFSNIYIDETVGTAGLEYEIQVYNELKNSNIPEISIGNKPSAGFSNQGFGDIEATYNGKEFNIEVKLNSRAQMGSGSISYNRSSQQFVPSPNLKKSTEIDDLMLILAAVKTKQQDIDNYLDALASINPVSLHKDYASRGIPFVASKQALLKLKSEGILAKINKTISLNSEHIARLYNNKKVFYIQIGGAGLFYLGSNPLNLDIPKFEGETNIEIRLKPAGDSTGAVSKAFTKKANSDTLIQARTVQLNAAARFLSKLKSPYSLDNVDSITSLFSNRNSNV